MLRTCVDIVMAMNPKSSRPLIRKGALEFPQGEGIGTAVPAGVP